MSNSLRLSAFVAALAVASASTPAFAQDYTASNVSGQYIDPPADGTNGKVLHNLGDDQIAETSLPFDFGYFGAVVDSVWVHDNGYIQLAPPATPTNSTWSNTTFPPSTTNTGLQGMCAPCWEDLNPTTNTNTVISSFTVGTSPNRKFVVDWSTINHYYTTVGGTLTFQLQLFENGTIVFAYGPTTGWADDTFSVGINAPPTTDTRWVSPSGGTVQTGHPGTDFQFVPTLTDFEGTLLVDEIVSDGGGVGNTQIADEPLAFVRVELVSGGQVTGTTNTDENGDFQLRGIALDSSKSGNLRVVAQSAAGPVKTAVSGTPSGVEFATDLDFSTSHDVGTFTLDDATDADFQERAPIAIAQTLGTVFDWVSQQTTTPIPQLTTLYDPASSLLSSYAPGDETTAPTIRIGSSASSNPDAFDTAMVARTYARHVLTVINGPVSAADYTPVIDSVSSEENALAEAFCLYVASRAFETSETFDGIDATTTTAFDLDDATTLVTGRGPDVGGWAAAAIFDLTDDANGESHDRTDGTVDGVADVPFTIFETLPALPTPTTFRDEWSNQGEDVGGLTRNFIHHGLFPDDAHEPNDDAEEASPLGPIGVLAEGLVLNEVNADWFEVTVEDAIDALFVDLGYNRFLFASTVTLEVRLSGGTLLATGTPDGDTGPIRAETGPIAAGSTVRIHIRHDAGDRIDVYSLQAYSRLDAELPPSPDWTRNRPLTLDLGVVGGIPPYTIVVNPDVPLPIGLVLDAANARVIGAVGTPGPAPLSLRITDSASPTNSTSVSRTLTINRELAFSVEEFLGVPVGRPTTVGLGRSGGTEPVLITNQLGVVPPGLQLVTPAFSFTGTATTEGSSDLEIEATDVAGSTSTATTRIVACVDLPTKNSPVDLAAGDSASGYFIDAVAGTFATLKVKTGKKREKRLLNLVVIGPDGLPVVGGKVKTGNGKAAAAKVPLLTSGRYYFILPSAAGGDTQLIGTSKLKLPKGSKGAEPTFDSQSELDVEFGGLAGAKMTFKAKTKDGLGLRVSFLVKPDGTFLSAPSLDDIKEKGAGFSVTHTLDQSGTWKLMLSPKSGTTGSFKWSLKLKQPKNVVFVAD